MSSEILDLLENLKIRTNNNRKNASYPGQRVRSIVLGQYYDTFSKKVKTSVWTYRNPKLWDILTEFIKKGTFDGPEFNFTSITINKNFQCQPHVDKNNVGLSYIIGLGDYVGGELTIEGKQYDIHNQWLLFDGKQKHWTEPFEGTRYTLVYYSSRT